MTTNTLKWSDLLLTKAGCVSLKHLATEQKESYEYAVEQVLEYGDWRGTILESKKYLYELNVKARYLVEQYIYLNEEGFFFCTK